MRYLAGLVIFLGLILLTQPNAFAQQLRTGFYVPYKSAIDDKQFWKNELGMNVEMVKGGRTAWIDPITKKQVGWKVVLKVNGQLVQFGLTTMYDENNRPKEYYVQHENLDSPELPPQLLTMLSVALSAGLARARIHIPKKRHLFCATRLDRTG